MEGAAPSRRGSVKSRRSRSFSGLLGGYPRISQGPRSRLGEAECEEREESDEAVVAAALAGSPEEFEEAEVAAALASAPEASESSNLAHSNQYLSPKLNQIFSK
ncbi:hypothetical protein O181_081524 [Austropuccinia psidii MF-1]|uniref:Uncharacterized protein n=1 Tax=Austropuccinia psidii MF-1 TaxID=1389203 RepID=A0A9Q3IK76_9BASI|nr:hypothetical protein [Austropuccinia psidii MF-1]